VCGVDDFCEEAAVRRARLDLLDPITFRHAGQCEHQDTTDPLSFGDLEVRDGAGGDYWLVECNVCAVGWQGCTTPRRASVTTGVGGSRTPSPSGCRSKAAPCSSRTWIDVPLASLALLGSGLPHLGPSPGRLHPPAILVGVLHRPTRCCHLLRGRIVLRRVPWREHSISGSGWLRAAASRLASTTPRANPLARLKQRRAVPMPEMAAWCGLRADRLPGASR
jgi:hypothetical protein